MFSQTIPDSLTDSIGVDSLDRYTATESSNEADSSPSVTLEWIQSLPQSVKDEALYRLCKVVEAKPTLVESFALNQVLYRTISESGETFFESADNVASVFEEIKLPKLTSVGVVAPSVVSVSGIPDEVLVALANAGIDLGMGTAERLWMKYSDKFEDALAYTIVQDEAGKIRESKSGYFRRSLEEN